MPESKSIPQYNYKIEELAWVPAFIDDVKDYFFPRPEDNLLILRPNKVMHLNKTAMSMLKLLFEGQDVQTIIDHFVSAGAEQQVVLNDLAAFVDDLRNMVTGNQNIYTYRTAKIVPFGSE
ncbi:MAG: PqqD family protein, partial [Candidatus Thorarchaeota archaeon]|nr:PqqD family protein [Candidatus Thorarchaeota archaeon]